MKILIDLHNYIESSKSANKYMECYHNINSSYFVHSRQINNLICGNL